MKPLLVFIFATCCFSNIVKSDSSSSEEDSADSSEELFGIENLELNIKSEDQLECIDHTKIEDVESCFASKCKTECVAANIKIGRSSQFVAESCSWGCTNQISTFKAAQAAFRKTAADLLVGTSVDRCWDGCIEKPSQTSDQTSCISGCETMRKMQRKQLRSKEDTDKMLEIQSEKKKITNEIYNDSDKKDANVDSDTHNIEQSQEDTNHVVRTYILWHPIDQQHAFQACKMMFAIIQKMFQEMDDMDNMDNDKQVGGGWKDDRRQLRIPQYQPRAAALTSPGDQASEVYGKVVDSLGDLKTKIQETISRPEFKENLFYCLMTICCFLLLAVMYDMCTEEQSANKEEDNFHLPEKAAIVNLPSYLDCIKADKYQAERVKDVEVARDIKDEGDITKADMSLTFSVTLDDEDPLHK